MLLESLKIISAGAGSGKTYRLTQELSGLLADGSVKAAGIIATTFTKKAAAELRERVRVKLLEQGMSQEANALSNALIGTVHALGVKLLQRFAFEAGVSPAVEIIPDEDHQRLFNLSMAQVIAVKDIERLEHLANRLGLSQNNEPYNWRKDVRQLVEMIRGNNFSPADIESSKLFSWESFEAFLPPVNDLDVQAANQRLLSLLDSCQQALEDNESDGTKKTLVAAQSLRAMAKELQQRGFLAWPKWAGLGKFTTKVGAKSQDLVGDLVTYAQSHTSLPAFHNDLKQFIFLIFDCASAAISEYDKFKKKRGQIDYTDMEVLVLELLENSLVQETLQAELDLLMVDEFQDTSPIQLAIFLRLSQLAKQSIWVGDPKQSIYGFRGAEPRLMQAVIQAAGGIQAANIQEYSWRSREDLVYLSNALFVAAFQDTAPAEVRLIPRRTKAGNDFFAAESAEQASDAAVWHWHYELDGKGVVSKSWHDQVIARSVSELLANPPQIRPKGSSTYRPLVAADMAILCRSNYGCESMAAALQDAGIPAAVARNGLLATAESVLLLACLKYLLNERDSLSVAEIMYLGSRKELADIVDDRISFLAQQEQATTKNTWGEDNVLIKQLDTIRGYTREYAPAELLNHLLEQLDLRRIIVAWGGAEQRLSNIDELRRLALQYEENCHRLQQAASIGGLLLYLARLAKDGDDKQGAGERPEAVNVLTYHRSKGLEWPVVICHNLDQPLRADLWGLHLLNEATQIDILRPLANRKIRYWVNPYGRNTKGLPLLDALQASDWQKRQSADARAEEARLLYVGITRARDYLVFPTTKKGAPWLDRVYGAEKHPVLEHHTNELPFSWEGKEVDKATKTWQQPRSLPASALTYSPIPFLADERTGRAIHTSLAANDDWYSSKFSNLNFQSTQLTSYYDWNNFPKELASPVFGKVVNAFLLADRPTIPQNQRLEMAANLIERFALPTSCTPKDLLQQAEAFRSWTEKLLPDAKWETYLPFNFQDSGKRYHNQVDLLLHTPEKSILVQHLIITGNLKKKLKKHLAAYAYLAWVVRQLQAGGLTECYIHLPVQGAVYQLKFPNVLL